ncbi:MAG: hypothetical protein M3N18_04810 [Actinomycetota bacterium]|nr:hypothetical protein [Actinomycetota bacterium]
MDKTVSSLKTRRNWIPREDLDALLEEKDSIIAGLKERVAFLSDELKRQDAILARIAEGIDEPLPARASEAAAGPRTLTPGEARGGTQAPDARHRQENSEKPTLPKGYRVVATASDAWVLVAPRGLRVAGYRGELDLWKAAHDAHEHHQRG